MQRNKSHWEIFLQNKVLFLFFLVVRSDEGDHDSVVEIHDCIYKPPLISNYAALFELSGCIKLTHRISCHTIFYQPRVHYVAEFSNWLMQILWGQILSGRHHGTRLWNCLDVTWLWRVIYLAIINMMRPDVMKPSMTQSLKISVVLRFFVPALLWCIDIMSFPIFRVTVLVFGCSSLGSTKQHPPLRLIVGQLPYSLDCRRTEQVTQNDAKANSDSGI